MLSNYQLRQLDYALDTGVELETALTTLVNDGIITDAQANEVYERMRD